MRRVPVDPQDLAAPGTLPKHFALPEAAAHYLRTVLRLPTGARVELFDGAGRSVLADLFSISPDEVLVETVEDRFSEFGESILQITLLQAIPKGDRWDWLLEKATELGVHTIIPLQTSRTVVTVPPAKLNARLDRWQKIAAGAARQCKRARVPQIEAPQTIAQALKNRPETIGLVAHTSPTVANKTPAQIITQAHPNHPESIAFWIGPEGGFDDHEIAQLLDHKVLPCSLGPRILRNETAGIAALTILQSAFGDM